MTRNRDIERVLEHWFADGPSDMPDRVFDTVIARIDRIPQRRLAQFKTRLLAMNSNLRLAAAAAVIVIVAGASALILSRASDVANTPSPTPGVSPTAKITDSWLPPELRYRWVGATRTVPQVDQPVTRSVMDLTANQMGFGAGFSTTAILLSTARTAGPDTIAMELVVGQYGCPARVVGTYTYALSGKTGAGGVLTLRPVNDACAARVAAVSGDWIRTVCADHSGACLGNLEAGDYQSLWLNPWVVPGAWTSRIGALTYAVPAGWTNTQDCDTCYTLAKQGAPKDTDIVIFSDVVAHADYGTACQDTPASGVGRTASAISTYLAGLPGLVATTPQPVTIGGLSGFSLDVSVASTWTQTCPFSNGDPVVGTFTDSDPATGGMDWNVGGDAHNRIILLDLPDGRALLIDIEAPTKAAYETLLPEAVQVVDSFQFNR